MENQVRQIPTDILAAAATAVDNLLEHECEAKSVMSSIVMMTMTLGYKELDAYASATQHNREFSMVFAQAFWAENSTSNRIKTLMTAVSIVVETIQKGQIDERFRKLAREALEIDDQEH